MRRRFGCPQGLTLVEVMAVLAVSGLLLVGMWQLYHGSLSNYQRGVRSAQVTREARLVLPRLVRDLELAYATARPYGIQGRAFPGTAVSDWVLLDLLATTYPRPDTNAGGLPLPGTPQRIRYVLGTPPRQDAWRLERVSMPASANTGGRVLRLSDRVRSLRLRYFDGHMWYDTWQRADLPLALEIDLQLQRRGRPDRSLRFRTRVTPD